MKNKIISAILLSVVSGMSVAECQGSHGSMHLPVLKMHQSNWSAGFLVNNVSDSTVTVKMSYTDHNGQSYSQTYRYFANFSSANSPTNSDGATLNPGTLGRIHFNNTGSRYLANGKISWYSDACIDEAITVGYYNQVSESSRYDASLNYLNDSQPF